MSVRHIIPLLTLVILLGACGSAPDAQVASTAPTSVPAAEASTAPTSVPPAITVPAATAAPVPTSISAPTDAPAPTSVPNTTTNYPLTIENCGRTLTFAKAPEHILVTYESMAEVLVALGLGDKIVGVQYGKAQERLPEQAAVMSKLPYLAEPGKGSASKEVLIATHPDFVLVTYFTADLDPSNGAASEADYKASGAQAYGMATDAPCLPSGKQLSIESIYSDIRNLGAIFGMPDRAASLIGQMQAQIAAVQQRVAGLPPVKAIYYEDGKGLFTIYGAGLATDLLTLAGGENVLAAQPAYTQVGQEVIANTQAEIWVITEYPGFAPTEQRAAYLYTTNLPASHNKRSLGINGAEAGVGIRLPRVIETLAKAFHPEAFAAGTAASSGSYPVTIENCGMKTTYTKMSQRVVTLYPPATEMLLGLGLKARIVGIADSGDAPLPADLLADYFYDASQGFATQDELRAAGANIYTITSKCGGSKPDATIDDVYTDLRNLGMIFGVSDKAEAQIATMQQRVAAVQSKIKGQPPVKVIYYDAGEGPLGIFGKGAWEYVLTLAGGENVFSDLKEGYAQISAEQVAARDTDVFIVAGYTGEGVKTPEERVAYLKATFPNSTAVKNNRVVVIPYEYTNPGLQNVEGVEALAKALYPTLFP